MPSKQPKHEQLTTTDEEGNTADGPPPYLLIEKKWNFKQVQYFLISFVLTQQYVLLSLINVLFSFVLALFFTNTNSLTIILDLKNNGALRPFLENIKGNIYRANRDNAKNPGGAIMNQHQNFVVNLDYILFLYVFISLNRFVLAVIAAIENVRRETDNRKHLVDHIILENSANCQRYLSLELQPEEDAFHDKNNKVTERNDRLCPAKNYKSHDDRKGDERYELTFVRRKKVIHDVVDEEESLYYAIVFLFILVVFFILSGVQLRESNFYKGMVVLFPFIHVLVLFMILKLGNSDYNKKGNPLLAFVGKVGNHVLKNNNNNKDKEEKKEEGENEKYFYFQKNNNQNNNGVVYRVDKKSIHRMGNGKLKKVQFYCFLTENTVMFFSLAYIAIAIV